jgi:cyclic pyranopterin phosphate synthase
MREHEKVSDASHQAASKLTHVDETGRAHMVDVGEKPITQRAATATAVCSMNAETAQAIRDNALHKGDVLQVARIAAIGAAKRTDELIPLCHSVPLDQVEIHFVWLEHAKLGITATAKTTGRTGVEMEALVAASLAALTIYDMCKSMDRSLRIENVELQSKSGGARGDFKRI